MREELKPLYRRLLDISYKYNLSHLGSCCTSLPILYDIYKMKKPDEKFILSAGHSHLAHLIIREHFEGITNIEELLERNGIHCDRSVGCDVSTGSLGLGIGIAAGIALSDRSKNVYCLISDGEISEGIIFECLRIAHDQRLDNLKLYSACNSYGAYDRIDMKQLKQRIDGFGFPVEFRYTDIDSFPEFIRGQKAHYISLKKEQYENITKNFDRMFRMLN